MRFIRLHLLLAVLVLTGAGCASRSSTPGQIASTPQSAGQTLSQAEVEASFLDKPRPYAPVPSGGFYTATPDSIRREWVWLEAGAAYERGGEQAAKGNWQKARHSFDTAIEVLLSSGLDVRRDPELRRFFDRLVDRIYEADLADGQSLGNGEEPAEVAAAIDEMVPLTFPPDAGLRRKVEEELAGLNSDLPIVVNDEVMNLLNYFHKTEKGRRIMRVGMRRRGRYREMIEAVFAEEGLPRDLINLAQAESSFRPNAVSRARAVGLWQFMSFRGREYGLKINWWVDERRDPIRSTRAAARHMRDLYDQFGDWYLVLAAYNGGPGRVQRAIERTGYADFWELLRRGNLARETNNHVPIILAFTIISKDPQRFGFEFEPEQPLRVESVPVPRPTSLRSIARAVNVSYATLRELNPHVLHGVTPPDYSNFRMYVPAGMATTVRAALPKIPEAKRIEWGRHRVRRGDTLSGIAARYGTSAYSISQANSISLRGIIRPGQQLVIPGGPRWKRSGRRAAAKPRINRAGQAIHTVRRGDTLNLIARSNRTTARKLAEANGLSLRSVIHPGQKLVIPGKARPVRPGPPAAAAPASAMALTYEVRRGDTLTGIASRHGLTARQLARANDLSLRAVLRVGDRLSIPASRTHRVRRGETLWQLGQQYDVSVRALRDSNPYLRGRELQAGDRLTIPGPATSASVRGED